MTSSSHFYFKGASFGKSQLLNEANFGKSKQKEHGAKIQMYQIFWFHSTLQIRHQFVVPSKYVDPITVFPFVFYFRNEHSSFLFPISSLSNPKNNNVHSVVSPRGIQNANIFVSSNQFSIK